MIERIERNLNKNNILLIEINLYEIAEYKLNKMLRKMYQKY